jgi:hypothetical protein
MEAPRPQAGASRRGNFFYIVSLAGHLPVPRRGSGADPLFAERLSALAGLIIIDGTHYDGCHVTSKKRSS